MVGEPVAYATGSPELKATGPSHVGLLTPRSPRDREGSQAGAHRTGFGGDSMNRLLFGLALVATPASATQPSSIFGIELGKPLSLPDCSATMAAGMKLYDTLQRVECREDAHPDRAEGVTWSRVQFPPDRAPLIAKWTYVNAYMIGGTVEGIEFPTAGISSQDVVLAQLKEKFGQPTTITTTLAQNAMGASFRVYEARWQSAALTVTFHGALDTFDKGRVEICSPRLCTVRAAATAAQRATRQGL